MSVLVPGRTCSACLHADRVALLVDAAAYFSALRAAILQAEHTVYIVGWDVDTRTVLDPNPADGLPGTLLEFLNQVLDERPKLRIFVLAWDFSVIYALERELLPSYKFGSMAHPRLSYALDGRHQLGAAHHQKMVVIDDGLAFCGGIDLTIRRWDTTLHAPADPNRKDPSGAPYAPMHDVQLAVSGAAAEGLGELVRRRWQRATGQPLPKPRARGMRWLPQVQPDLLDVEVAIVRTEPSDAEHHRDVREVEQLTLESLKSAEHLVYIENQYLTAAAVAELLCQRLSEPGCPELIVVLPKVECGWLEQSSMGVLRERVLRKLSEADVHGRLHTVYPEQQGLGEQSVNVHSKLLIVDDRLLKVGSSNLSNRSLGLDTECDLAIEAPAGAAGARVRQGIAHMRRRLLAEHLGMTADEVARAEAGHGGSLAALLRARRSEGRGLRCLLPLPVESSAPLNLAPLEQLVVDPERPMAADAFINGLLPVELQRPVPRSLAGLSILLGPLIVLAIAWHTRLLRSFEVFERTVDLVDAVRFSAAPGLYVMVAFVVLGFGLCPVTLLVTLSVLGFGPLRGSAYALLGALVSASVFYGLGRALGRAPLDYLRGPRMSKLRADLRRRGFRATTSARLFPLGNFTAINLLAGALYVPFGPFFVGNLVGLLPGVLGTALCAEQLESLLREPSPRHGFYLVLCVVAWSLSLWFLGRVLSDRPPPRVSRRMERRFA
ncbi:MAG: VTT domain-containing protein [Myxococcales bacterium]